MTAPTALETNAKHRGEGPTTLTLTNRKGGVAKSTSTLNLAAEFTAQGHRVLCVDMDPQATLTLVAGHPPDRVPNEESVLGALLPETLADTVDPDGLCVPAPWGGDILRANPTLANAEVALNANDLPGTDMRLNRALASLGSGYDYIFVDSPPSMSKLVLNAICAADHLLVPVSSDFASVGGLDQLFDVVEKVRTYVKPDVSVLGVFATQTRRTLHSKETQSLLEKLVGELMFQASIPQTVGVQDAQTANLAIREYDPQSKGARGYRKLSYEIQKRLGHHINFAAAA